MLQNPACGLLLFYGRGGTDPGYFHLAAGSNRSGRLSTSNKVYFNIDKFTWFFRFRVKADTDLPGADNAVFQRAGNFIAPAAEDYL
ncbi:hypothetical protein DPQ22_02400 [Candidatus Tokpelaia sp.]|nr:hypothetical protein DPQ22_02400 [Candidatus Tokpelaia sp.]